MAFREFYFEFSDFQHAYEKGFYVGADDFGIPIPPGAPLADAGIGEPGPNPRINRTNGVALTDSFRVAINPPAREQATPLFPNLVRRSRGRRDPGLPGTSVPAGDQRVGPRHVRGELSQRAGGPAHLRSRQGRARMANPACRPTASKATSRSRWRRS